MRTIKRVHLSRWPQTVRIDAVRAFTQIPMNVIGTACAHAALSVCGFVRFTSIKFSIWQWRLFSRLWTDDRRVHLNRRTRPFRSSQCTHSHRRAADKAAKMNSNNLKILNLVDFLYISSVRCVWFINIWQRISRAVAAARAEQTQDAQTEKKNYSI